MQPSCEEIRAAVAAELPEVQSFLENLIAIPSLSGEEAEAMAVAEEAFRKVARVERVAMSNALRDDKDYSDPISGIDYEGRHNLRIVMPGRSKGKALLLGTHIDTVPPSQGQREPFTPHLHDGSLYGRGACDAKGQVATIYLVMRTLRRLDTETSGDLIAHVVVEEENGGNGALAMVRQGEKADGCVVLEPTDSRILTSIRGAVWFRIALRGRPGHSGMADKTSSALNKALRVIGILETCHAELLGRSRGDPLFDRHPNPMPLTIGEFHAGNWPATAPGEAVLAGVLGFLPNVTASEVMKELEEAIATRGGAGIAEDCEIHFTYRHDASVIPCDHPLAARMSEAARAAGIQPQIDAMTASCDAWLYNNQLGIPTLVFGPGSLGVAHSNREHIPMGELARAGEALVRLSLDWCT